MMSMRACEVLLGAALLLGAASAAPSPTPVVVSPAAQVHVFPPRDAAAVALARNESQLGAELAARIAAIPVEVGQRVDKGAVVVRLDDADARLGVQQARAALNAARARLRLAEQQLERARDLHAQQFISADALAARETETAVVRAEVTTASAALRVAQRTLAKTVVRAPFAGAVTARMGQVGEIAQPGTPLVELVDTAPPEVSAAIASVDAAGFIAQQRFAFDAQGRRYPLRLLRLSPVVSSATRTREARLAFTETPPAPGTEGRLLWQDGRPHLPADVIVRRTVNARAALGVFVVEAARAKFVPIPGAQAGRPALSPLAGNAQVIVSGQAALQHDDLVQTTVAAAASGPR